MRRVRLYYAASSWVHRLHPSTKLVVFAAIVALLTVFPWRVNLILFALLVALLASTRVPVRHYWLLIALSLPFMAIAPLLNAIWPPDPAVDRVVATIPLLGVPLYAEGLLRGISRDLLFGGSLIVTIVLLATTELPDLADAPTYLGAPHVVGFTFAATLRYIPEVANFLLTLYDVQESRGVDFYSRNPVANFARRTAIFIPLLVLQLSRASRMSNAMESRGFRIRQAPTLYALRPMGRAERAAVYAFAALAIVLVVLRAGTLVVPGDYPLGFGTF